MKFSKDFRDEVAFIIVSLQLYQKWLRFKNSYNISK